MQHLELAWYRLLRHLPHGHSLRLVLGVLALGQGIIRIDPFDLWQGSAVSFLNDLAFGGLQITIGVLLLASLPYRSRWYGRLAALLAATFWAMLGAAIMRTNFGSGFAASWFAVVLVCEGVAYD